MNYKLTGVLADYDTSVYYPESRDNQIKGEGGYGAAFHDYDGKDYQDHACNKVRKNYGINSCFKCPLAACLQDRLTKEDKARRDSGVQYW